MKKRVSCAGVYVLFISREKSLGTFSSKWSRMFDLLDNDGYIFKTRMAWKYLMWRGKGH